MRFQVLEGVPPEGVHGRIPPAYRPLLRLADLGTTPVTILVFRHGPNDVIHSRDVRHALAKRREPGQKIVAVGNNFTKEARDELDSLDAAWFILRDFFWTDESHDSIRQAR